MIVSENQQQTAEAEDKLNSQVINESINDKSNKIKEKHTQIRENQILNSSTDDKWYTETQTNHKNTIKSEQLHLRKSNFKRHIQTDDQKIQIPSEEYFKWPTWIEQSDTVSFYRGSHIPIDIPQFEEQRVFEPDEDNRIITTLMHSQMRVEPKIVQGTVAQARDFPFLVSLKRVVQKISKTRMLWKNYCGGSIINSNKVVTAAHCFEMNKYDYYYHPNKLRVVAGNLTNKLYHSGNTSNSNQNQVRQIKLVKLHRNFNFPTNDIALVFVDEPFRFNNPMSVNFIVPAKYHTDYARQCYAAGFGQTGSKLKKDGSDQLLFAEINLLPRQECNKVWEMNMITFLCSPNVFKGVSGGDSGGPVACFESLDPSSKLGSGKLLVGIKVSETKHLWSTYCGGSIIHPTRVLTAAHCFDMKNFYYLTHFSLLRAVAGSTDNHIEHQGFTTDENGVQWRQITDVQLHYDFHFPVNDIAIINVDIPFDYNRIISYYNAYQNNPDYEGTCFTAGFGQIGVVAKEKVSKVLLWAEIHLIAKERCTAIWGMNMDKFVCSDTIVTDISGGDAGGPLVCPLTHRKTVRTDDNRNFVLVGIASGKNSDKTRLYTRVAAYQNWIDEPTYRTSCARRYTYLMCTEYPGKKKKILANPDD
ncbi:unnamed protein product [Arctia plantaginis]|uniref:Peptidase S1 domain-containing protein n=1 Tax=Arctia plantaginis TaxID=874455 RepID=A0A8S0ZZA1_ARCPL|nr:unnamed protein product [Arctia plantaginis]